MTGDTEQQADKDVADNGGEFLHDTEQQAPGLDWDAASRKMIEQARGTPEPYWMIWYEDYDRRPELFTIEMAARVRYQAALTNWSCHLFCSADQLAAAQERIKYHESERDNLILACDNHKAELASSQHSYKLLAEHAEKQAEEIERGYQMLSAYGVPRERARYLGNGIDVLATRFGKEIAALKQQLADMTEDYLRRHKDAADRSEEVLTLRIEIAALKQRLERMRFVGAQMSNVCYNGAQQDRVPDDIRKVMRRLYNDWDALAAEPPA